MERVQNREKKLEILRKAAVLQAKPAEREQGGKEQLAKEKESKVVSGIPQNVLENVRQRIIGTFHTRQYQFIAVKVFGSRTKGTHRSDSDTDMVVIIGSNAREARDDVRIQKILESIISDFLEETGIHLDLSVHSADEIHGRTKFRPEDLLDF